MEENETNSPQSAPDVDAQQSAQGQQQQGNAETVEQVKKQIRRLKLKVNGQERQLPQDAVIAFAQKGLAADQKFQKAAAQRKRVEQLIKLAKEDPDQLLRQLRGQDPIQFYKQRLARELQELSLDPKQKQLREYKRKIEQFQRREQQRKQQEQASRHEKAVDFWTKKYDKELPQAIKAAGLPLTQDVIKHTAQIMLAALEDGYQLPMSAVMQLVRERHTQSVKKFLTAAQREKLVDILGQDFVDSLVAAKAKKSQKSGSVKRAIQQDSEPTPSKPKSQKQAMRQLQERIKKFALQ